MNVFVVVDWAEEEVLAVYKTKDSAETHIENECDGDKGVTISEMVVFGDENE
jgi:hypothetical protein